MKINNSSLNERGIAHLGLIVLIVVIVGLGVFAYMRVSDSNKSDDATTTSQTDASTDEEQQAADAEAQAEEAGDQAESADTAASVQENENVVD